MQEAIGPRKYLYDLWSCTEHYFVFMKWGVLFPFSNIDLGAGVTLDQGVYIIQVAQWAFRKEPVSIKVSGVVQNGVDMQVSGVLKYPGGGVARISADSTKRLENQAIIKGSKGTIVVGIIFGLQYVVMSY